MDGRYEEVYDPDLITVMKDFIRQEGKTPNAVITNYPTDIVLLNIPTSKFSVKQQINTNIQKVFHSLEKVNWKKIYEDEYFVIFVRPDYPLKVFSPVSYEPLNASLSMFETDITKELLYSVAKKRLDPFSPNR